MPTNSPLLPSMTSPFNARSTALEVIKGISLIGKNAIVTGGASGLGLETSRAFASAGANLTLVVRNLEQGHAAATELLTAYPKANIQVMHVDLADLASVAKFAADWNTTGASLAILINNAAIMANPLTRTPQGWESQFATNHLGHFALTTALLPALLKAGATTGDARVVCLSSTGHKICGVDFDDIHFERREYNKWKAYGQAKSANAMFALALHLKYADQGITANAVHPGGIMTGLQKHLSHEETVALGWYKEDGTLLDIFKTPEQGASTSVWAATSPQLKGRGGMYLEDCFTSQPADARNRISGYSAHIQDEALALKLWAVSEQMLLQQ